MYGDNLCNRLGGNAQGVIGLAEGIEHGELWINLAQTLIVDHQQGVDMLLHLLYAVEGLVDLTVAFETEGDGDDTNGQNTQLL